MTNLRRSSITDQLIALVLAKLGFSHRLTCFSSSNLLDIGFRKRRGESICRRNALKFSPSYGDFWCIWSGWRIQRPRHIRTSVRTAPDGNAVPDISALFLHSRNDALPVVATTDTSWPSGSLTAPIAITIMLPAITFNAGTWVWAVLIFRAAAPRRIAIVLGAMLGGAPTLHPPRPQ